MKSTIITFVVKMTLYLSLCRCILLAGHRPYREFPLSWTLRHLETAGFRVVQHKSMTILHSENSILRQLNVGRSKLPYMAEPVRAGMAQYLTELE